MHPNSEDKIGHWFICGKQILYMANEQILLSYLY